MRFSAATLALLALGDHTSASADLHSLAVAAGKHYFGTATDNNELSDSAYTAITKLKSNFGAITPGNGQKWDYVEATQNVFQYSYADVVPNFARANGQIVRCHTLLYRSQTPAWVTSGSWTKDQMTSIITTHIKNVVGHYKGQCYSWDVVNEAIDDSGNYRETVFYSVLGADHLTLAFNTAHEVDPAAKLYYNDYNIETANAKQQKTLELIKYVQDAGAPIHGVGLQGHFIVGSMPSQSDLESAANAYAALGVDVAYTELDVKFTSMPYTSAGLQSQAEAYVAVINACLNVERCVGWTIWDWTDKYSWVPGTFPGQGGACLFDNNFKPKPAYSAVSSALAAAATRAPATKISSSAAATATPAVTSEASSAVASSTAEAPESSSAAATTAIPAVTSNASSAVISAVTSASTAEAPKPSSSAVAVQNTTAIQATPITSSGAITSAASVLFPTLSTKTLNATAIYPNGTATATGPLGGVTSATGGVIATLPDGSLTSVAPGSVATLTVSGGDVTTISGSLPSEALPGNAGSLTFSGTVGASAIISGDIPAPTPSAGNGAGDAATTAPSYVISTVYTTNIHTITSCAPTVTNCPARASSLITEVGAFTTTVWASTTPAAVAVPAPAASAPIGKCERKRLRRLRRRQAKAAQKAAQRAANVHI